MADVAQQVIVEFIADTTQLQPAEDKLVQLGKIDQQSATIFKATNAALKDRNTALDQVKNNAVAITVEATKEQTIYNKLVASVKNLSGASKDAVQSLLKLTPAAVAQGFDQAAVAVDDYIEVLEGAGVATETTEQKTVTIRTELKNLVNQLAVLTAAGQTETEQFQRLALQAGKLQNALQGTQKTVANLGQDVPVLKVFGAAVQGMSAGFTLATGAAALFGDENKDLQEVLIKVNAVMAINAGITELVNLLNDESTLSTAKAIATQSVRNATIAVENGLQSQSVVVRGAATVAQYALNLAMSLNPIGLLLLGIAAFVAGIAVFTSAAKRAAAAQASLNAVLDNTGKILDAGIQGVENSSKKIISALEARNARQSEIQDQEIASLKANNQQRLDAINELNAAITANENSTNKDVVKSVQESRDRVEKLEQDGKNAQTDIIAKGNALKKQLLVESLQDQANNVQARLSLAEKNSAREFALERQLAAAKSAIDIQAAGDDAAKVLAIRSALARQLKDIDIAQAAVAQDAIAAANETALIKAQNRSRAINDRVSQEEIDIQKKGILEVAAFQAAQKGIPPERRKQILEAANQQALELQRKFETQSTVESLEDQKARSQKALAQVEITETDKLNLQIDTVKTAAAIEIEQNKGKSAIIQGIEADRDAKIKALRLQSIKDTLDQELALEAAQQAGAIRNIERQLAAQDEINNAKGLNGAKQAAAELNVQQLTLVKQKQLIDQLTAFNLEADTKRLDALQQSYDQGLISTEDFNLQTAVLIDQSAKHYEDGEARKQAATKKTAATAKQHNEEILKIALEGAAQAVAFLQSINEQESQAALQRISAERQAVQDLSDAGAITAKEATARNKKLDVEQKQLQTKQAQRAKQLALFAAIINTAQAVTNALTTGDPYTAILRAAIAGAIGLAQIALIARQKPPSFGKGKKDRYTGLGEVGETGPELIRRGKSKNLQLAEQSTITWLGPTDIVYNPKETAELLAARVPSNFYPGKVNAPPTTQAFDYDRFGKAVGDNIPQQGVGFDENGLYQWTQTKQGFTKYLNHRRRWLK